ncbi:MAG TPA: hypothetical protein PKO06_03320, partial [Candidatus Ozemobacteraceae bacterium]|nr:hypothetical protein [Candidatus Ozemobacteraceae bacterium]
MRKQRFIISIVFLALCLFLAAPVFAADEPSGLKLDLKGESSPRLPRSLGEFNVSLDSTLAPQRTMADTIRPTRDLLDLPRAKVVSPELEAQNTDDTEPLVTTPTPVSPNSQSLSSTFTFRPGYLQTNLTDRFTSRSTRTVRPQGSRLSLTGITQQEPLPLVTLPAPTPTPVFANRVRPRGALPSAAPGSPILLPSPAVVPSVVDHYLLEATYNFNPAVQGKVSYQRSQFDP